MRTRPLDNVRFAKWEYPKFDTKGMTEWNWICQHHENLKIGLQVDIGAFTYINAKYGVRIEDFVQIGSHCSIYSVSTIDNKKGSISLCRNSKIGSHSVIMPGVRVGENALIGAFTFVNRDVPANTLAYGIPVRVVRRFRKPKL